MQKIMVFAVVVLFSLGLCLSAVAANRLRVSGDNAWVAFVNGEKVGEGADWQAVGDYEFDLVNGGAVIAVYVHDAEPGAAGVGGALVDIALDDGSYFPGDETWKADAGPPIDERNDGWETMGFDDSGWDPPVVYEPFGEGVWGFGADTMRQVLNNPDCTAFWIWAGPNDAADDIYLRFTLPGTDLGSAPVEAIGKAATTWGQIKAR